MERRTGLRNKHRRLADKAIESEMTFPANEDCLIKTSKPNTSTYKAWPLLVAAFVLPVCVCLLLFGLLGVEPFGNRSIGVVDANIQYVDFFRYYRNCLLGQDSLLYSFSNFLGETSISLFAYYLASPWNLLILLFPDGQEHLFLSVLATLKIGLAGLTFEYFLLRRFPDLKHEFSLCLALAYALMQYNLAQSANIMWLDGVYMLPLIMLGLHELVVYGRSPLYVVALTLSVLFNWYTAYFNCLAIILMFVWELLADEKMSVRKPGVRVVLHRSGSLALHTLTALLLSAFLFLPTILDLLKGKADIATELENTFSGPLFNLFEGFAVGSVSDMGKASLFCGSLALLGVVLYFLDAKFSVRERFTSVVILLIMVLSMYWEPLEYVANGFRGITRYWYRYSYVVIFFMLMLAARTLCRPKKLHWQPWLAAGLVSVLILTSWAVFRDCELWTVLLAIVFLAVCAGVLSIYSGNKPNMEATASGFLVVVMLAELTVNGFFLFQNTGLVNTSTYKKYVRGQTEQIAQLKQLEAGTFRISEQSFRKMTSFNTTLYYDSPMADSFMGITHYSSTASRKQLELMHNLGYSQEGELFTVGVTRMLPADGFLGAKYMVGSNPFPGMKKTSVSEENDKNVYENTSALSLGVVLPADAPDAVYDGNPFRFQEAIYSSLTGTSVSFYKPVYYWEWSNPGKMDYVLKVPKKLVGMPIYGRIFTSPDVAGTVSRHYNTISRYPGWLAPDVFMVPLTDERKPNVHLTYWGDDSADAIRGEEFYVLDMDSWRKACSKVQQLDSSTLDVSNGEVHALVADAKEGESLLLTVPYDNGWTVLVNGTRVVPDTFADCFMRIPLEEGYNQVDLEYHVPGLMVGICISAATAVGCVVWLIVSKRKRVSKR